MDRRDDFAFLDATAQADLVRRREVKPVELVDAAIERIDLLNPALNAVVTPTYEQAHTAALGELPEGPFRGVPFLLKDLFAVEKGVRMSAGSTYLRDYVPDEDSELVLRLRKAGLVFLGRTNAPEFGLSPTTEPALYGPCCNPWDTSRTPGGSSGGSAAAVASGMVPMAHGNDGGGSIRIPSSCCGVFGLKPTRGRNPFGPGFGDVWGGMAVEHALTLSVRDSAALLDVTSGPDLGDPYWAPPPARPFSREAGADPGRLRIAFSTESIFGYPVHPDCVSAARSAAALCEELGHDVEEAAPPIDGEQLSVALTNFIASWCAWSIDCMAQLTNRPVTQDLFEPYTWALYEMGRQCSAPAYLVSITHVQKLARDLAGFLSKYDLWLTPTTGEPPPPLGSFDSTPENPLEGLIRGGPFVPFTPICNVTGHPAMSVPLFWNSEGLPIGSHFAGRFGDEATLIRLAAQLEEARPWARRQAPVLSL